MPIDVDIFEQNAVALNNTVCLLAAKDFVEGNVYYHEDISLA